MNSLEATIMKRQKRDKSNRAYTKGYITGISGRSKDICPHGDHLLRQTWLNGWREGRYDNWDGMTGVSGVHRISEHSRL